MAIQDPLVEGPEFARRVNRAEELTQKLQANQWDFDAAPDLFNQQATCDVLAKEIAIIHDGKTQTRVGRLVMQGIGEHFNLVGPESPLAILERADSRLLDSVNEQLGSRGLHDFEAFQQYRHYKEERFLQNTEFYNFTTFYQLRDMVFWSALYQCGLSPSGFEIMSREIAAGKTIHNVRFSPPVPSANGNLVTMQAACLMLTFPTPQVEWMDKPIFGGMVKETIHVINLLTLEPTDLSHPYLPLVREGKIKYGEQRYYLRRFAGISPKQALRGPGVPPEGAKKAK